MTEVLSPNRSTTNKYFFSFFNSDVWSFGRTLGRRLDWEPSTTPLYFSWNINYFRHRIFFYANNLDLQNVFNDSKKRKTKCNSIEKIVPIFHWIKEMMGSFIDKHYVITYSGFLPQSIRTHDEIINTEWLIQYFKIHC